LLTGSDPRTSEKGIFLAKDSAESETKVVERVEQLSWWDGSGKVTLIDCPGLSDS